MNNYPISRQFSEFMSTLVGDRFSPQDNADVLPQQVIPKTCQSCFRYSKCWEGADNDMGGLT